MRRLRAPYLPNDLILLVTHLLCAFCLSPFVLVARQALWSEAGFIWENFRDVTVHWNFPVALRNTLNLAAAVVPIQLALANLMTTMVNQMGRARDLIL